MRPTSNQNKRTTNPNSGSGSSGPAFRHVRIAVSVNTRRAIVQAMHLLFTERFGCHAPRPCTRIEFTTKGIIDNGNGRRRIAPRCKLNSYYEGVYIDMVSEPVDRATHPQRQKYYMPPYPLYNPERVMTVSPFSIVTAPFWRKLARKPSGSKLSARSLASAGKSLSSLKATWTFPSNPQSTYFCARRYNVVSIVDQPGTSTAMTSVVVCVVSRMRLNVMWDRFEDVRVERRSSLADVGRQIEVRVNAIR